MGEITRKFCSICGAGNPIGSSYCCVCGSSLSGEEQYPADISLAPDTPLQNGRYIVKRLIRADISLLYTGRHTFLDHPVFILEYFGHCNRQGTKVQPLEGTESLFENSKRWLAHNARLLFKLNHPGIVRVYDAFEENNTVYMVMEFLKGKPLSRLLDERGVMEEAEAVGYIVQVAEALEVVHQAGYLHRDIKPDNIFICLDGRVVLALGFDIARPYRKMRCPICGSDVPMDEMVCPVCDGEITKTEETVETEMEPVLTPGYAPLEQYGEKGRFGPPLDIYALGATLYHLLTGQMPPSAPDRIQGLDLIPPHQLNPKVSRKVSDAVMKAMAMRIDERPQRVWAFIEALR